MRTVDKQKESAPESESAPTRCRRPGYPVRMTLCAESLPATSHGSRQPFVVAVAEWPVGRVLTLAQGNPFLLLELELERRELRPFVRAVAVRLVLRPPTAAPPIRAWFQLKHGRCFRRNHRFAHGSTLLGSMFQNILDHEGAQAQLCIRLLQLLPTRHHADRRPLEFR